MSSALARLFRCWLRGYTRLVRARPEESWLAAVKREFVRLPEASVQGDPLLRWLDRRLWEIDGLEDPDERHTAIDALQLSLHEQLLDEGAVAASR